MKPHYNVVAAVVRNNGEILCMQRGPTRFSYTSYKYEFPGGKVEPGETPRDALRRELQEELDLTVGIVCHLLTVHHVYPDFSITMAAYLCDAPARNLSLKEHHNSLWLPAARLHEPDWAAADLNIARHLRLHFLARQ